MKIVIDIDNDRYEDVKRIASVQINHRFPTVEQIISDGTQQKTGQWLYGTYILEDSGHYYAECSECHCIRIIGNYCPNCGTKMNGSEESEV